MRYADYAVVSIAFVGKSLYSFLPFSALLYISQEGKGSALPYFLPSQKDKPRRGLLPGSVLPPSPACTPSTPPAGRRSGLGLGSNRDYASICAP